MRSTNLHDGIGQRRFLPNGKSNRNGRPLLGKTILITENKSKLGKRWIAKQYKDGELIASYPGDTLSDIDLTYFVK